MVDYSEDGKDTFSNEEEISHSYFESPSSPQIPSSGYAKHSNDSDASMVWLDQIAHATWQSLQHSRIGGKYRIPTTNYSVDGYHTPTMEVYEFLGCWLHQCMKCCKDKKNVKKGVEKHIHILTQRD